jgi:hypothetical protein
MQNLQSFLLCLVGADTILVEFLCNHIDILCRIHIGITATWKSNEFIMCWWVLLKNKLQESQMQNKISGTVTLSRELSQARLWRGIATISNSTDPSTEASVCEPSCRPNPSGCSCPIWKDRFPCRHCCALLLCTKQGCVSNGPWADIIIQTSIVFNQPKVCGLHAWCTIWCTFSPA